ncbi:hypothetical protein ACIQOV_01040 [Kitasatospora sp. NPDC091257]|uniref:hypothetical protein n=1 Tax=unclassified Kitasatospora TaxID=2633591 RepID=UPI002F91329E
MHNHGNGFRRLGELAVTAAVTAIVSTLATLAVTSGVTAAGLSVAGPGCAKVAPALLPQSPDQIGG